MVSKIFNSVLFPLVIVALLGIPAAWSLFIPGYFPIHDDIQIMRLLEMDKCFQYGQIPCRWVPDMGAGFGHPLFNYHPVLPYYVGQLFNFLGFSYINSVKALLFLGLILPGIFLYFLIKEFFGKLAGIVGGTYFIYAPYHAVDIYVRGALTEIWGIMFFPLILLSLYKYIQTQKFGWFVLSIISISGLLLSHNIMTMLFMPISLIWLLIWTFLLKKSHFVGKFMAAIFLLFLLAGGISAFFVIPAFFELKYINVLQNSGYYNYQEHFVYLHQLFLDNQFEYGGSTIADNDHMSFQIGYIYWTIWGSFVFLIPYLYRKKKFKEVFLLSFVWVVTGTAIYMTHARSFILWQVIPMLTFVQFPWRFLGIVIFTASFLVGAFSAIVLNKQKKMIAICLIIMVISLNMSFFKPERIFPNITDNELLSGKNLEKQSKATLGDYIPIGVRNPIKNLAPEVPSFNSENVSSSKLTKKSDQWMFTINNKDTAPILATIPVFYFPEWIIKLNNQKISYHINDNGLMEIYVPQGSYLVSGQLINTPIRDIANTVSLISVLILAVLILIRYTKLNRRIPLMGILWSD